MRLAKVICISLLLLGSAGAAFADPVNSHDEKTWSNDLGFARSSYPEVEPNNSCPGQPFACGDVVEPAEINPAGDADFYEFSVAALPTTVTIGTDAYAGSAIDTYLELYGPDCSVARLTYDDDSGPGAFSLITNFNIPAVGLYHIKVRHYSSTGTGAYKLFLNCTAPQPPPANDTCAGAIALERCATGSIAGDLTNATDTYNPAVPGPSCTGYAALGKDVTYKVDLQAGDILDLTYVQATADASIYIVTDCANVSASCVAGADDAISTEVLSYTATAAGTYYIIADCYGTNVGGAFTLAWTVTCPPPAGACCLPTGECRVTSEADCATAGGQWYGPTAGCDPNPCPQPPETGACCFANGLCIVVTQIDCAGQWMGVGTVCAPNPCPQPPSTGACCFPDGSCTLVVQAECPAAWLGPDTACSPNPCPQPPPTGACCFGDGSCTVVTQAVCEDSQGLWQGADTVCVPNPCPPPVPTERISWGQIKSQYR